VLSVARWAIASAGRRRFFFVLMGAVGILLSACSVAFVPPVTIAVPPNHSIGSSFIDCNEGCPQLVVLPAGRFLMGSLPADEGHLDVESPLHEVNIDYQLAVGRYKVSKEEFAQFIAATNYMPLSGCWMKSAGVWVQNKQGNWANPGFPQESNHPAVCVSWNDAQAYVQWLSLKTGKAYRLLSEAEWEYAARSGSSGNRYWGEEIGIDKANCLGCGGVWNGRQTAPLGIYGANAFGLYDMLGNAREWVADCWKNTYTGSPHDGSAWLAGDCSLRVHRAGAWIDVPNSIRAARRNKSATDFHTYINGFRIARALP